ncbi:DsbA family protein [Marinifilum sp. D714]|uniref:DsbA family protein n=1 Tax=Marinifilum sp. D714 TaxID=2937523 RepID=UPI0027BD15FB|nr:DsbA family protein [Marinifilum sp. D714]MDQ2177889.1 DsbA family protein [Marinifilum sp. D714]
MKLLYFSDPMCSWCYGFTTVIDKIQENYPQVEIEIIPGGYSPGNKEVMSEKYKNMLQRAWASVNLASGQAFDYSMKFVHDKFCYDTEPSSRAFHVIQELVPEKSYEFLKLMQSNFYAEGKDITKEEILADLAEKFGIEREVFIEKFNSKDIFLKTNQGFLKSRELGVTGFPSLIGEKDSSLTMITPGFQAFENVQSILNTWLNEQKVDADSNDHSCNKGSCKR